MMADLSQTLIEGLVAVLVLTGGLVALLGAWGLLRLPDFFMRLHGPTKASTLGVGCILLASMLYFSWHQPGWAVQQILVTVFLFVTAPVSAHMMAKAALHRQSSNTDYNSQQTRKD